MKPGPFDYHEPTAIAETLDLLAGAENAKLLAGGQSLMPMMNFRYVMPDTLIDLNRVAGLDGIAVAGDSVEIGAMTRQRSLEFSAELRAACPLLGEAIPNIGHRQTRNRGTIGGSLSHADPSAELPTVAMAMDAVLHIESKRGTRRLPMAEFSVGYMTTALEPDELLTRIAWTAWPQGHGFAFLEFARRRGDFAIVSVAALLALDAQGVVRRASLTVAGVGPTPLRLADGEKMMLGEAPRPQLLRAVAVLGERLEAASDIHASGTYRRHLAQVLLGRALTQAVARAQKGATAHG